jgi:hypothetical protein
MDPSDITYDQHDEIGSGTSSTVYRGTLQGSPAAIKVYDRIRLGQAGGAAGIDQLMTGILRRELCIIARAQGFHHVCRSVQITGMGSGYSNCQDDVSHDSPWCWPTCTTSLGCHVYSSLIEHPVTLSDSC